MKAHPIIPAALSALLAFLPSCAARMAQQEVDTLKEQFIAIQQASEFMRLERLKRGSKCQGAHDTFIKLIARTPDPRLQPVLDYLRHAYAIHNYMQEKRVTAERALAVMGDLVLPPRLSQKTDPFNGCILLLGDSPNKRGDNKFVFVWDSRDWREREQAQLKALDKFLPPEKRTPFIRFAAEYVWELMDTLEERLENGEITLLQFIKALNAGDDYLDEQGRQYLAQLKENLIRAKAQDDALLATVAIGLGAVATAALAVSADANYRIANAETARAAAAQAQAPIRCNYTLPGRYGTQGYIYCR